MISDNLILLNSFKITSADTDLKGRIRLGALINLLIQSAINSADSLGFGFNGLQEQRLFWVLSRLTLEIHKTINWYDEVIVETWPKDLDKILYIRDFIIRDKKGTVLAKATSGWLAIDIIKKRPKIIDGLHSEIFHHLKDKHAIAEFPAKLFPVKEGDHFKNTVQFFDVDLNKHVTSTRYIDWMMNSFPFEFHEKNYPKGLSINYLKETMPNETIKIIRNSKDNTYFFEGSNETNEVSAFRGKIDF